MITVQQLSFGFPNKNIFDDISFTIEPNKHYVFIGSNGSGKSTLIKMLMNPDDYLYDGKIEFEDTTRIGMVQQFSGIPSDSDQSVYDYIAEPLAKLQAEIDALCDEMATTTDLEACMARYQVAMDAFDALGGHQAESDIDKQLGKAGLSTHKLLAVRLLSDGEFKLVQMIKEMLYAPDLLILDEPDVFLDFDNLCALKALINSYKGSLLVVTHNRYLLNHCFNRVLHLEDQKLQNFEGTYSEYKQALLQTKVELQELAVADADELARNEAIIHNLRTIASSNSEAARGRALKARVRFQERLEARRIQMPFVTLKIPEVDLSHSLELPETAHLNVEHLTLGYDDETLLEDVSFEIGPTDKVALIGPNGSGKSTLLRTLFKHNHPAIQTNPLTHIAYISQDQHQGDVDVQTLEMVFRDAGFDSTPSIVSALRKYGFEAHDLGKKMTAFSGGEKSNIELALLTSHHANLMLLDEPTCHLDTYAQMALEGALKAYNGAIVMISHDFYTIANTMDYVFLIEDKGIRKLTMRKFRKRIYDRYFDVEAILFEERFAQLETEIERALSETNFELAKQLCDVLLEHVENKPK